MRSLGLDIGGRRIGVAVSDPLGISAAPLEVLRDVGPSALREYLERKASEGVEVVVVGLPLTPRGREGEQALRTREFVQAIEDMKNVRVVLWDERFSTLEARKRLREAGHSLRGRKVDAEAAAIILQSYLECGKCMNGNEKRKE
ncbi:MAG: Holliday junction resolvase RuvX [Actinomycetota bacterium]|nr:Holliday junction resolvase RuvX [Actinomycetota bacterium]MDD5665965.1 Holliday junction resolvase RuvX [Actinomycetota bacterium]